MSELLEFLVRHCDYLYLKYRFRFIDSQVSEAFGDAYIILESPDLRLRFTMEKSQLFLDVQGIFDPKKKWYSIDLIRHLTAGESECHSILDEESAAFLRDHMDQIISAFSQANNVKTLETLKVLVKARTKRIFGKPKKRSGNDRNKRKTTKDGDG